ncbi:hypothetical protein HAX54_004538 [Datura stramonium]|uniref:Uncharacterized protein n=1 Tax=Datura stramonium TaxID=4076 RepID=A0ABS8WSY0_DATST|nr:hypothetical protein [Datura stramonium]
MGIEYPNSPVIPSRLAYPLQNLTPFKSSGPVVRSEASAFWHAPFGAMVGVEASALRIILQSGMSNGVARLLPSPYQHFLTPQISSPIPHALHLISPSKWNIVQSDPFAPRSPIDSQFSGVRGTMQLSSPPAVPTTSRPYLPQQGGYAAPLSVASQLGQPREQIQHPGSTYPMAVM